MEINVDTIKELVKNLDASSFDSFKLETKDFKLALERGTAPQVCTPAAVPAPAPAEGVPTVADNSAAQKTPCKGIIVKCPIVGTFYESASPDKPPFAKVGQKVKNGDTLYIVESMKLMNEITSECDGTVAEIYVKNGQSVEYGQPIMRIE